MPVCHHQGFRNIVKLHPHIPAVRRTLLLLRSETRLGLAPVFRIVFDLSVKETHKQPVLRKKNRKMHEVDSVKAASS